MSLFADLRAAIGSDWTDYTEHSFVQQLGAGTLPLSAFQDYLVQDYLFLVQFARAYALAGFKSKSLSELEFANAGMTSILTETHLHRRLTERWGISPLALESAPEKLATVAYTRYVLDCGMSGSLLDLNVALAPCMIGYSEIGRALEPLRVASPDHPYGEWISEYSAADYALAATAAASRLDDLAGDGLSAQRFDELVTVFRTATRLESAFWQQALDAAPAPVHS